MLGHIASNCPQQDPKKKRKRKFHAHAAEEEVPSKKAEESSEEEYVLILALTCSTSPVIDIWLVDSGASKHMKIFEEALSSHVKKESPHKVKLGDDF